MCLSNCCVVFQAERADSLPVGISNERKTELLESVLQPCILWDTPCADTFHSALQFQVSPSVLTSKLLLHMNSARVNCPDHTMRNLIYVFMCTCVSKVLEEHVPPVWSIYAPTSVYPQNNPDSEREQPQGRELTASAGECELTRTNSLYRAHTLKLGY